MLCCPKCKERLIKEEGSYKCLNNHCYDVAKQGYTNLFLKSSKNSGDSKEMVEARSTFLNLHHYDFLVNALIDMIQSVNPSIIIDVGCGEGYYTNLIQESNPYNIIAFDVSKDALKYAAKKNKKIDYFLASIFDMPLNKESGDIVLNVFSPLAKEEYGRVLKKGGYLIKVDPNLNHLQEMKDFLYDEVYENEILNLDLEGFELIKYNEIEEMMNLDNNALCSLFKMTPYYYKTNKEKALQLMELKSMKCRASFIIYLYKKV